MSGDLPSSNPFRRKGPAAPAAANPAQTEVLPAQQRFEVPPPLDISIPSTVDDITPHVKPVKKVRVQSPPPSSPQDDSIPQKPPTPIPRSYEEPDSSNDPFELVSSDESDTTDDEVPQAINKNVPLNPFQKTLATIEHTEGETPTTPAFTRVQGASGPARGSMDVEAFKRLLMTGSTEQPSAVATPSLAHIGHGLNDGTSTDTSSISKQSIFESIQENHPESPRTSHEVSEPDEERRRLRASSAASMSDRKKPPPPSSRHGKLIKVELKEEDSAYSTEQPRLSDPRSSQSTLKPSPSSQSLQSQTDLNKPLPPAPSRASHDSDRESIFDKESAGKTPEPFSPPPYNNRKTPPAPPISRRHSNLISDPKLNRVAPGRQPTKLEEDSLNSSAHHISSNNSGTNKAPPPPPTRRPISVRHASHPSTASPLYEPERSPPPAITSPMPPLIRMPSTRQSNRSPSVSSMDMPTKRSSFAPPPPPPRQRASSRTSVDAPVLSPGSSRHSEEHSRKSIESTRDIAATHSSSLSSPLGPENSSVPAANDILADLTALQKEVDALRGQFEKDRT